MALRPLLPLVVALSLAQGCAIALLWDDGGRSKALRPLLADRCAATSEALARRGCEKLRDRAQGQVEALHVGDPVCLDPPLGDDQTGCRARGKIDDQDTSAMRLRIIEASPESRWRPRLDEQLWVENAALVDMYLAERGF
ncbi:MAG: hypothetical protein ACYCWW_14225 [Deltaproteobacteria bacterium]